MSSGPSTSAGRWPSARKFGLAMALALVSVPMVIVNDLFAIGIPAGLILALLWWFDFTEELRASPPAGRSGRVWVWLAGLPQGLLGLTSLMMGLALAAWVVWDLFAVREAASVLGAIGGLFIAAGLAACGLGWLRGAFARAGSSAGARFEAAWTLQCDDFGVSVHWPKGEQQTMAWDAVDTIAIETNDSGPWGADVWTVLEGQGERVLWPQGSTGEEGMLAKLQRRYPGFDDDAVIAAMGCTDNARFVCWRKGSSPGTGK